MSVRGMRVIPCALLCIAALAPSADALERRPLTVADVVSRLELVDLGGGSSALPSPDGRYIATVVRRADLQTDTNEFRIILYETEALLAFVEEAATPADTAAYQGGRTLLRVFSATNDPAISQLRWLRDSATLAFLGSTPVQPVVQVYTLEVHSGSLRQLSDHPQPVVGFDLNRSGDLVFSAHTPIRGPEKGEIYYVGDQNILQKMRLRFSPTTIEDIYDSKFPLWYQVYFIDSGERGRPRPVGPSYPFGVPGGLWISPDGRTAILAKAVAELPPSWVAGYPPLAHDANLLQLSASADDVTSKAGDRLLPLYQLFLIDLRAGTVSPVLDAPLGYGYGGYRIDVQWLAEGRSVILANTFPPLGDAAPEADRDRSPVTAELDLATGAFTRIVEHPVPAGRVRTDQPYAGLELRPDGTLIIKRHARGDENADSVHASAYKKEGRRWREVQPSAQVSRERVDLLVRQDLNTPPNLFVVNRRTGRERQLTDLNPQLRAMQFGAVSLLRWRDRSGEEWEAGLVYPVGYRQDERYPLVIQTHGFQRGKFLIEGPQGYTGAYAAQALANKGIMVLQVPDHFRGVNSQERATHRLGIEAAIDELDARGLIDRRRVGLIGFSRTGHYVQHLITFSDYDFAAATIADAVNMSFMGYVVHFGASVGGMEQIEQMMDGATPWGERLQDWIAQSPVFHLDRVKTPLRLEQYTELINWWDVYAILKRQSKPVEWLVVPGGEHLLERPSHRLAVQQQNVDWFVFWLKSEEDADPAKAQQYARWRKLRDLQEKSESAAAEARALQAP